MSTAPNPLFLRIRSTTYRIGLRWDGSQPLTIGRGGENGVVLSDPAISAAHVRLERRGSDLFVTDLNSRNGTRIGTRPLTGTAPLHPGETIELARQVWITPLRDMASGAERLGWALKLSRRPGLLPIRGGRQLLADLVPGLSDRPDLYVEAGRRLLLHDASGTRELQNGDLLCFGEQEVRFVRQGMMMATPAHVPLDDEPWQVVVSGATTRPSVRIRSSTTDAECWFRPAHSATLLMLLAARQQEAAPSPGWTWDDDLRVGLWGRAGLEADPNNLNVVLYRIRRRLQSAGIDLEILVKEPNRTRLDLCHVRFEDSPGT